MKRTSFALMVVIATGLATGCASKNYVRQQVTPLVNKTDELDQMTAKNARDIRDVDTRAQAGIQDVQSKAAAADQRAQAAGQQADQAQSLASQTATGVNRLTGVVANLDNYQSVVDTSVHFAFNSADLSPKAKEALDELGAEVAKQKHYIVEVEGGTDSVGDAAYNYELSQRRADAVIQYLVSNYQIPAYRIYMVGLGKDKPTASNKTAKGRADNRRVEVHLMTNSVESDTSASNASAPGATPQR
ncbi:MAG TPA: OmpA family protein [Terriglobales bacterium]|nr:OmpA family protein [Terriglobales bacterium]